MMISFVANLTFALRLVVGNAWLMLAHGYANNGGGNLNSPRVWEQAAKLAVTGLGVAALYGIMASGGITGIISALNAPTTAGASLAITAAAYNQLQNQ